MFKLAIVFHVSGEPLQILFLPDNTVRLYLNGKNILRSKPKIDKKLESIPNETVVENTEIEVEDEPASLEEKIEKLETKEDEDEAQGQNQAVKNIVAEIVNNVTDVKNIVRGNEDPIENYDQNQITTSLETQRSEYCKEDNLKEMSDVVNELVDSIEEYSAKDNIEEMSNVVNELVDSIEECSVKDNIKEMSNVVNEIVDAIGKPTGNVCDKDDSVKESIKSNSSSEISNDSKHAASEALDSKIPEEQNSISVE